MKRLFIITLMALFLVSCSSEPEFQDNKGNTIQFSKLHGKWVLINYWATWCHSCIEEIPQLNAFYKKHQNKVVVLGVNYDGLQSDRLTKAINKFKITYPVLTQNPRDALKLKDPTVIPATYIINPDGKLTKRLLGPQTEKTLNQAIGLANK